MDNKHLTHVEKFYIIIGNSIIIGFVSCIDFSFSCKKTTCNMSNKL